MILGLSHVAISTATMEAAKRRLTRLGYHVRFAEPELCNDPAKTPLLTRHQAKHHICALAAEGVMAVELIDHGCIAEGQAAPLLPVICLPSPEPDWERRSFDALPITDDARLMILKVFGEEATAYYDPVLSLTLIWRPASSEAAGLEACVMPSRYLEQTEVLLTQLRFRADENGLWSLLTPIASLQAKVLPVPGHPREGWTFSPMLDQAGCPCLAFMARGSDVSKLSTVLCDEPVSFHLSVNHKMSRITQFRASHGPIIELIDQSQ